MHTIHNWETWLGTDEAGKGDYFGPVVVAGVHVNAACREAFAELGITDGKTLSIKRVRQLAEAMRCGYNESIAVVQKMPAAYNALYDDFRRRGKNLNHLLGALHAEVIETLHARSGERHVCVDRFAKADVITPQIGTAIRRDLRIKQVPKAERDIAVAAASIIARDAFLTGMETLSKKYEFQLPRGSYRVTKAGKEFVAMHGASALGEVAKLHFSLTEDVLAPKVFRFSAL